MTRDQERWAEALAFERWKGDGAIAYVADRIADLSILNDHRGVERLEAIAHKLQQLTQCRGVDDAETQEN